MASMYPSFGSIISSSESLFFKEIMQRYRF